MSEERTDPVPKSRPSATEVQAQQAAVADFLLAMFDEETSRPSPESRLRPNLQLVRTDLQTPNNGLEENRST